MSVYINTNAIKEGSISLSALTYDVQKTSDRVTTLSSASTSTQYPAASAVYNIIHNNEIVMAAALNSLNNTLSNHQAESTKIIFTALTSSTALTSLSSYELPENDGFEKHYIIQNTGSATITITLPSSSPYICVTDTSIDIDASAFGEVNIVRKNSNYYVRGIS